jgi:hypothetical protein
MWPNPRIPYQMSCDRPRPAPLKGKPIVVKSVARPTIGRGQDAAGQL